MHRYPAFFFLLALCCGSLFVPPAKASIATTHPASGAKLHRLVEASSSNYSISVLAPTSDSPKIGVGLTASMLVTITPTGSFAEPIALACSNLPDETTCTFALATIPPGGGTTTMLFNTSAPRDCGSTSPYFYGNSAKMRGVIPISMSIVCAALLLAAPFSRRKRRLPSLLAIAALAGTIALGGCGYCTDLGTRPGTYTFNLTTTPANSGSALTIPITIIVSD